ncbi:MAG: hypothetical protein N2380_10100, partial [bacterium]|nr:hypothetical protein [bacterium]
MPNPLNAISPIWDVLNREVKILPAIGRAIEELQHPDQEEIEDKIVNKEVNTVDSFAEETISSSNELYRETPPIYRSKRHLFRFFIDGSIRTYFLGTGIEGNRSFPIELSQVGAAVIKREDDGSLKVFKHNSKIILLLPKQGNGLSDTLWEKLNKINKPPNFEVIDFTMPDLLADTQRDPRDKAGAKARSIMHRLEIELIKSTDNYRNNNSWLILDGSVKFTEMEIWESWKKIPYVIGVAKSFKKDIIFQLRKRTTKRVDLVDILARLPYGYRTVAFNAWDGDVAFWYVRIREQ